MRDCVAAVRARYLRRPDDYGQDWQKSRFVGHDSEPTERPAGTKIDDMLGFAQPKKNGSGDKKGLNVSLLVGRTEQKDPRSTIRFFRTHLGSVGDLLSQALEMRSPQAGPVTFQGDLSTSNLPRTFLNAMRPDNSQEPVDGTEATYADLRLQQQYYRQLTERFENGEQWSGLIPAFDRLSHNFENRAGEVFAATEGVYTKPILLLNDKMSGSGGDFFPAQMQANGRATVMGETSCGLGGPVYRKIDSKVAARIARITAAMKDADVEYGR